MDLGIAGRKALVCGASKGLGRGCAEALAQAGVDVTIVARTQDSVRRAAEEIEALAGRTVAWVACDIARSGLTGFVAGLARKVARHNVTINNLLPGSFDTDRFRGTLAARAKASGKSTDEVLKELREGAPAGRVGKPAEFGATCAFLCSVHAGYITGQNILMDGGLYPGAF